MNEEETRAELIDPKLLAAGWGVVEGTKVRREYYITKGRIRTGGREKPLKADYVLMYKGRQLAVIEAKSDELSEHEGVGQAKEYAAKLDLKYAYATNGKKIYAIHMGGGWEDHVDRFPTPDELWEKVVTSTTEWEERFNPIPLEDMGRQQIPRYYQELAVNKTLEAIANNKNRILLTLATGTGKTTIAFHIVWKLYQTRWNLMRDGTRRPRVLFLADRNFLADQAFSEFTRYAPQLDNAFVRISPNEIRRNGQVPTNGSIFFTIFQTFMSGPNDTPYFGKYPKDFFDIIIIDECHRGGANDEGNWRAIMEYFSPAVQLGLTATPKRDVNVDTYKYFGDPVFTYSLKDGINDGFLTPYKVRRITTTIDEYTYTSEDTVIEGEVEEGKVYKEADFNRIIEIKAREKTRVKLFMDEIKLNEKAIVFCATQDHAAAVRDLINQYYQELKGAGADPMYCVRVTANDGKLGEQYLSQFQDNDRTIPTILTTSQKLSTGVDARNIRSIVLMRPVNSMVEFKQIIGRGTRLFDEKEFFTIYDFVGAYHHFADPEWDGIPEGPPIIDPPQPCPVCGQRPCACEKETPEPCKVCGQSPCVCEKKVKIKLADGKEREIQHMADTLFYDVDGRPITAKEFMEKLYGKLPEFFKSEDDLRRIWSNPVTRKALLEKLAEAGYGKDQLAVMQRLINAENSDLFDVLEYVKYSITPITREMRVAKAQSKIFSPLNNEQKQFVEFVLSKYIETGVEELNQDKLPGLLELKYQALDDAKKVLGEIQVIRDLFVEFQKFLYVQPMMG